MNTITGFETALAVALTEAGYDCSIIDTGGGCTAWEITDFSAPDWYVLITDGDLTHAITRYSCLVVAYRHDPDDAVELLNVLDADADPVQVSEVVTVITAARHAKNFA